MDLNFVVCLLQALLGDYIKEDEEINAEKDEKVADDMMGELEALMNTAKNMYVNKNAFLLWGAVCKINTP